MKSIVQISTLLLEIVGGILMIMGITVVWIYLGSINCSFISYIIICIPLILSFIFYINTTTYISMLIEE
jgi:hypothetical protein